MEQAIYKAIADVLSDVGAVGKDSKNPNQGYKYRGIDAVMNAMHPAMAKHGIFVAPEVLDMSREERTNSKGNLMIYSVAKVRYTFFAGDGSSVTATVVGEGMDTGDKSMNKAMSAAFKYALFQVFCIPTEEMVDSETDTTEVTKDRKKADKPAQVKGEQVIAPVTNEVVRQAAEAAPVQPEMCGDAEVAAIEAIAKKLWPTRSIESIFSAWPNVTVQQYAEFNQTVKKLQNKAAQKAQ